MPAIQIYEGGETPEPGSGPLWIRMLVHESETDEDRQALSLFEELAGAIGESDYPKTAHVLTILRLNQDQQRAIGYLPQIINGKSYEGLDEIRAFVTSFMEDVRKPSMI